MSATVVLWRAWTGSAAWSLMRCSMLGVIPAATFQLRLPVIVLNRCWWKGKWCSKVGWLSTENTAVFVCPCNALVLAHAEMMLQVGDWILFEWKVAVIVVVSYWWLIIIASMLRDRWRTLTSSQDPKSEGVVLAEEAFTRARANVVYAETKMNKAGHGLFALHTATLT